LFNHFYLPSINRASCATTKAPHGAMSFSEGWVLSSPVINKNSFLLIRPIIAAGYCSNISSGYFSVVKMGHFLQLTVSLAPAAK
jgi:hypothetical protein